MEDKKLNLICQDSSLDNASESDIRALRKQIEQLTSHNIEQDGLVNCSIREITSLFLQLIISSTNSNLNFVIPYKYSS